MVEVIYAFTEATVRKTTEAAASVASNVATALISWTLLFKLSKGHEQIMQTDPIIFKNMLVVLVQIFFLVYAGVR